MKPLCYPSVQIFFFKNISSYKIDINIDNYDWVGSKIKKIRLLNNFSLYLQNTVTEKPIGTRLLLDVIT